METTGSGHRHNRGLVNMHQLFTKKDFSVSDRLEEIGQKKKKSHR